MHPQIVINIAQWIYPEFDVKVSGWIYEFMVTGKLDIKNTKNMKNYELKIKIKILKYNI